MAMGKVPEGGDDELGGVFAEINITPLTDIFLVLLIIFMVGAAMAVDAASGTSQADKSGMKIDLPRGAAKDLAPGADDVSLAVLSDGRVLLDGAEVSEDVLVEKLKAAQAARPEATVILQADEGVPHGKVVSVMESARTAGFVKLAVATRGE